MNVILFDVPNGLALLLIWPGIALVGALLALSAFGYTYYRHRQAQLFEAASARVLAAHPELSQATHDFRVYAHKVMCELGWQSVSFTYS